MCDTRIYISLELHYGRIEYLFSRLSILSILFTMRSKTIITLDFNQLYVILSYYDEH